MFFPVIRFVEINLIMINKTIIAATLCLGMAISSCKKTETLKPTENENVSVVSEKDIEIESNILKFKDWKTFRSIVTKLEKNEPVNIPGGFESLNDLYEKVVEAEVMFSKENKTNSKEHSALYNENKESVYYTEYGTGNIVLEMDVYSGEIAKLINKKGLVIIGSDLYAFSRFKANRFPNYTKETVRGFSKNNYSSIGITPELAISLKKIDLQAATNRTVACQYCYNEDYHYASNVFEVPFGTSRQNLLEVFVEQVRVNCNVTETQVKMRGRFLSRIFGSGTWAATTTADMWFSGEFSGPRSPSQYYYPNPFNDQYVGMRNDWTLTHCYDAAWGSLNCFSVTHATYKMVTAYNYYPTTVGW